MRTILFIIAKEFEPIFRNEMIFIIFILPFVQLLILSLVKLVLEVKAKFSYIDHDHSTASEMMVS
jgi:ABC-2 type transport system permease protein